MEQPELAKPQSLWQSLNWQSHSRYDGTFTEKAQILMAEQSLVKPQSPYKVTF